MGRCVRVGAGLAWTLLLAPACFTDPPSATDPPGTEADGSTAALSTSSSGDATGPGTVTGTTTPEPADSSSGEDPGGTTSSSSGGSSISGASSSSDDTANTTTGTPVEFFDDFERDNGPMIGNGWVEKLPAAWQLQGSTVNAQANASSNLYYDFMVHREEAVRDLTIQVEFLVSIGSSNNEPHLVLRMQPSALDEGDEYTGYILVPRPSMNELCIMRFDGGLDGQGCAPWPGAALMEGETYRLTFTAIGDQPVELDGTLEQRVESDWEEVMAVSWQDGDVGQGISDAGVYGFSGGTGPAQLGNYRFDNFYANLEP